MNTGEFLDLLNQNEGKELVFEYKQNEFVPAAYHITEIKSKHINSVDCGGIAHSYDETVVQLWISGEEEKSRAMEAEKALKTRWYVLTSHLILLSIGIEIYQNTFCY